MASQMATVRVGLGGGMRVLVVATEEVADALGSSGEGLPFRCSRVRLISSVMSDSGGVFAGESGRDEESTCLPSWSHQPKTWSVRRTQPLSPRMVTPRAQVPPRSETWMQAQQFSAKRALMVRWPWRARRFSGDSPSGPDMAASTCSAGPQRYSMVSTASVRRA